MEYKKIKGNEISGHLDIFFSLENNKKIKNEEVLVHGNSEGLRSFAKLLNELTDLNQEEVDDKYLPIGAREYYHLRPGIELSNSSSPVIFGRLDAKGTGDFYERFKP